MANPQTKAPAGESVTTAYSRVTLFFAAALVVGLGWLAIEGELSTWRGWVGGCIGLWLVGIGLIAAVRKFKYGHV